MGGSSGQQHSIRLEYSVGGTCGQRSGLGSCSRYTGARVFYSEKEISHAWHMRQPGGGACGVRATRGTCARQAAERAAGMPRVAHAPGGRRSVRRACHAWHLRLAGGVGGGGGG